MRPFCVLLFILLLLVAGCSSKNVMIDKDYSEIKISNGILLIPKITNISFQQDGELFTKPEVDSIKNYVMKIYNDKFDLSFKNNTTFSRVGYIDFVKKPELVKQSFEYKDAMLTLNLPSKKLPLEETANLFILFIQDFDLNFTLLEIDKSDPKKTYSAIVTPGNVLTVKEAKNSKYYLGIKFNFAIYDQNKEKVVSYGSLNSKEPYTITADLSTMFIKLLNKQADYIVKGTPFVN